MKEKLAKEIKKQKFQSGRVQNKFMEMEVMQTLVDVISEVGRGVLLEEMDVFQSDIAQDFCELSSHVNTMVNFGIPVMRNIFRCFFLGSRGNFKCILKIEIFCTQQIIAHLSF